MLTWATAILVVYTVWHVPIGLDLILRLTRAVWDVTIASAVMVVAGALGRKLSPCAHPDSLACLAIEAAAGLGVLSLLLLLAALAGQLHVWLLTILLAVLLVWLRQPAWQWLAAWAYLPQTVRGQGRLAAGLALMSVALIACALLEALAPPVHFDALTYHLTLPQITLATGALRAVPDNPFWGLPLATEMLYAWVIGLGRTESATVLGVLIGVVTLVGLLGAAQGLGRRAAGWVAVAVVLAGQTAAASLGWGYADWLAALFGLTVILVLDAWRMSGDDRLPWLAGALAGFGVGAKLTAAAGALAGAAMLIAISRGKRSWKPLLAYAIAATAVFSPWLFKNLLLAGNPLFPFVGANPWVDALRQAFYREVPARPEFVRAILTPVLSVLQGVEGATGFAASLGPLLLGLLPGVFVLRKSDRAQMMPIFVFVLIGWGVWATAGVYSTKLVQSRLYFVLVPGWALAAAAGFVGLDRLILSRMRVGKLVEGVVALALLMTALRAVVETAQFHPLGVITGSETPQAYLGRRLGAFQPAMAAVAGLGKDARILTLWEPRALYCLPECSPDPWLDRWYAARRELGTPDQILQAWRTAGYTHILLYRIGMDFVRQNDLRYSAEDWDDLSRLLGSLTPVANLYGAYDLYRLSP
jgi:hypothetical protein